MLWMMDTQAAILRFVDLWHAPAIEASVFCEDNRNLTFQVGNGLIGQENHSSLSADSVGYSLAPGLGLKRG
jgi:hypothetical protein